MHELRHLGFDRAGRYRIHSNPLVTQLRRLLFGQVNQRGLAGAVRDPQRARTKAGNRRNVHHAATACRGEHHWRAALGADERPIQIGRHHRAPFVKTGLKNRLEHRHAGVVHQAIDAPETINYFCDRSVHLSGLRDVCHHGFHAIIRTKRRNRSRKCHRINIDQRHAIAVIEKPPRHGQTNATRRTSDYCDFVVFFHAAIVGASRVASAASVASSRTPFAKLRKCVRQSKITMNPTTPKLQHKIRRLTGITDRDLQQLAEVLIDCVDGGASVSFMHPLSTPHALAFWRRVAEGVARNERALLVAEDENGIVGTVQLILDQPDNQPHRADIAKMLVHRRARRHGLGELLMRAAEQLAREHDKTLLVLDTVTGGDAERLYARLGWQKCGVIPGYALWPRGGLCDTTYLYRTLG